MTYPQRAADRDAAGRHPRCDVGRACRRSMAARSIRPPKAMPRWPMRHCRRCARCLISTAPPEVMSQPLPPSMPAPAVTLPPATCPARRHRAAAKNASRNRRAACGTAGRPAAAPNRAATLRNPATVAVASAKRTAVILPQQPHYATARRRDRPWCRFVVTGSMAPPASARYFATIPASSCAIDCPAARSQPSSLPSSEIPEIAAHRQLLAVRARRSSWRDRSCRRADRARCRPRRSGLALHVTDEAKAMHRRILHIGACRAAIGRRRSRTRQDERGDNNFNDAIVTADDQKFQNRPACRFSTFCHKPAGRLSDSAGGRTNVRPPQGNSACVGSQPWQAVVWLLRSASSIA